MLGPCSKLSRTWPNFISLVVWLFRTDVHDPLNTWSTIIKYDRRGGPSVIHDFGAATWPGEPVFVRQSNVFAATFHPELTADTRVHSLVFDGALDRRASA